MTTIENALLEVELFSFGFKYGSPKDVNILWDVRFLPNPYWEDHMRHLTGQDPEVAAYVLESKSGREFILLLTPMLLFLLNKNQEAEKKILRIGIGCTGGQHRSVAVVERMAGELQRESFDVRVYHRDIANG